jgi:tRNA uridine 5-carboxymethylaminomethyl modification enzyme
VKKAYKRDADLKIPINFDYKNLPGLTNELIQKLTRARPENIADLSRIPGMTPAGIMVVLRKIRSCNS